jgi:1,4-dihydroxy-2-naphthoate octaprenyltransferase
MIVIFDKKPQDRAIMSKVQSWLLATRPKTLTAAVVPILTGTALANVHQGSFSWSILIYCLLSATFIQIGTNLVNDAVDFKKGADTAQRIGPRRVTQSGLFTYQQVLIAAAICFILALLFGIPLVQQGGIPIVVIGLISILMGYSYTSGPFPLAYLGLGDLFVVLFFGIISVGGVFYLQTGQIDLSSIVLGLQIGFLSTVLIAINNLRDVAGDRKVGKKTLAVRFGEKFVRWEIFSLLTLPFLAGVYWCFWQDRFLAFLMPLFILPLALKIAKLVFETEPSPLYNKFLGMSALVHMLFGLLWIFGVIV